MISNDLVQKIKDYYDLKNTNEKIYYWGESLSHVIKDLAFVEDSNAHIGALGSIVCAFKNKKYRENSDYRNYYDSWDALNEVFFFRNRWLVDLYYKNEDVLYFLRVVYIKMLVMEGWLNKLKEKNNETLPLFFEEYEKRVSLIFGNNLKNNFYENSI